MTETGSAVTAHTAVPADALATPDEVLVTPDDNGSAPPVASRAIRLKRITFLTVRVVFTLAVLAAVTYATITQWHDVRTTLLSLAWPSIVLSFVVVLLGLVAQTFAYRAALTDLGYPVPVRTAGQIYLVGLAAKYLPGSVWSLVVQMELGKRAGIPRSRALLAAIVILGLSTTAALVLGAVGLPALLDVGHAVTLLVLVLVPVSLVCAHPRVLTWLVQKFLRLTRRAPLARPISARAVGEIIGWCTLAWVCFGLHLWLLANSGATPGLSGLLRCVGAFALALTAGIVAFLSPSGIGVRESILTAALLPYVDSGVALGMGLASRMIFTVADLTAAGLAALTAVKLTRWAGAGRRGG